jgi:hypothetical protein
VSPEQQAKWFHAIREHEEKREGILAGQVKTFASLLTFELLDGWIQMF